MWDGKGVRDSGDATGGTGRGGRDGGAGTGGTRPPPPPSSVLAVFLPERAQHDYKDADVVARPPHPDGLVAQYARDLGRLAPVRD